MEITTHVSDIAWQLVLSGTGFKFNCFILLQAMHPTHPDTVKKKWYIEVRAVRVLETRRTSKWKSSGSYSTFISVRVIACIIQPWVLFLLKCLPEVSKTVYSAFLTSKTSGMLRFVMYGPLNNTQLHLQICHWIAQRKQLTARIPASFPVKLTCV